MPMARTRTPTRWRIIASGSRDWMRAPGIRQPAAVTVTAVEPRHDARRRDIRHQPNQDEKAQRCGSYVRFTMPFEKLFVATSLKVASWCRDPSTWRRTPAAGPVCRAYTIRWYNQ